MNGSNCVRKILRVKISATREVIDGTLEDRIRMAVREDVVPCPLRIPLAFALLGGESTGLSTGIACSFGNLTKLPEAALGIPEVEDAPGCRML